MLSRGEGAGQGALAAGIVRRGRLVLTSAMAVVGLLLFAPSALAAPPANDDFADAQGISLPQTVNGTLIEATVETPGEPDHTGFPFLVATHSVWYEWTSPATTSKVKFSTCAPASSGPAIAVYEGDQLGTLIRAATSSFSCKLKFSAAASTTYKIAIFRTGGPPPANFQLELRQLNPPANDDFVNAATVPATLPQTITGTTVDATAEPSEPASASVWYQWTPTTDVRAKLEICEGPGPSFQLDVDVYTGTELDSLTLVADDLAGCRLYFDATQGVTYTIAVDVPSGSAEEGPFQLLLRQLIPPPNDDLANAQVIPAALPQNVPGSTLDATVEPVEPGHFFEPPPGGPPPGPPAPGPPGSVWYEWSSGPTGGEISVNACNFDFGASVAVYTGETYGDPLQDAADNDGGCLQRFTAAASTTYKIAVASHGEGDFNLNLHVVDPPDNDNLANAETIPTTLPQDVSGSNVDATGETGEPFHFGPSGFGPDTSVWYQWDSGTGAGEVVVDLCEDLGFIAAVYEGNDYSDPLERRTTPDGPVCRKRFTAEPSTNYKIAVDGFPEGTFSLNMHFRDPPPNDDFEDAQTVGPGLPVSVAGTVVDAFGQVDEPFHAGFGVFSSVWYEWTPTSGGGQVTVDTCGSDLNTQLAIYTGTALDNLDEVASNHDSAGCGPNGLGSLVTFSPSALTTYWIAVDAAFPAEGPFTLAINSTPSSVPPPSSAPAPIPAAGPTGKRAAALKKCKKKRGKARKKCIKKAKRLPV